MHLESVEVVNFRGISRLTLALESDVTVLFGENAWGKTSLVEALMSTLGSRPLTEADIHRVAYDRSTLAQRMSITLGFSGEPDPTLEGVGWRDEAGRFHLRLSWIGRRPSRGQVRIRRAFLDGSGREFKLPGDDQAVMADLVVATHPLHVFRELRLADQMLQPVITPPREVHEAPDLAVLRVFERLLAVPHQVHPEELSRGLEALHRLAEIRPDLFRGSLPSDRPSHRRARDMAEAPLSSDDGRTLADLAHRAGSGMRQVTLLALVGAMLKAEAESPRRIGAQPILLLEDPETHLHPIQLATAWNLVEQLPAQKIVTTAHGELLGSLPMKALRRLVRRARHTEVFPHEPGPMNATDTRRVAFHVRTHRTDALFARAWLLVEGETEAWLLPELARVYGLSFPLEGIRCVEFAQAGLAPLIGFADRFGIPWHVVADGDDAGQGYAAKTRGRLKGRKEARHLTVLPDRDIEHHLWRMGFADTFREAAQLHAHGPEDPEATLRAALRMRSKPGMALELAEAAGRKGPQSIPPALRRLFATLRKLAQGS